MSSTEETSLNPAWLDEDFVEKILRLSEDDENLKVTSHELTRATAPGDNYASDMFRIKISFTRNGKKESKSLIIKAEIDKEDMSKIYEESQLFQREAQALYKVVPEMYNVLNTVSTNQFKRFSPKCYYSQSHPSIIVMEDLKEKGFKLAKRMLGLDMKHSSLVIKQIARYHAASVVLYETNPDVFEPIRDSIYKETVRETLEIFYGIGMKAFANEVKRWPEYSERFGAKLHEIAESSVDLLIAAAERVDGDFNCFVHGDLWLNNMMFLYADDIAEVEEVRFVDYQMCLLSRPALDLQCFLYTSVSIDLLDQHRILIEEYHKTLGQTLSLLGYEHLTLSFDQLLQQLDKAGTYAIIISSSILPFVFADESNIPNVEKMIKDEEDSGIFSQEFKNAMKLLLLDFERKKWL